MHYAIQMQYNRLIQTTEIKQMRVTVNNQCFDDDDKRCSLRVNLSVNAITNNHCYLVSLSCFDTHTGATNWYNGITPLHPMDYELPMREKIFSNIMETGGDVFKLINSLNQTKDYLLGEYQE